MINSAYLYHAVRNYADNKSYSHVTWCVDTYFKSPSKDFYGLFAQRKSLGKDTCESLIFLIICLTFTLIINIVQSN